MHLLADISYHGYGHIAQTAPVVNALRRMRPDLRLTLRCAAPAAVLARHFDGDFEHLPAGPDPVPAMDSAVDVRLDATHRAYSALHRDWERAVADEARRLERIRPDAVLAAVGHLALAGAARAGIASALLGSFHWAAVYRRYCAHLPGAARIHAEMLDAYRSARAILRLTPGMPLDDVGQPLAIGPVARLGRERRDELRARLGLSDGERPVLVALGGIPMAIGMEHWPPMPGLRWLVPAAWRMRRADASDLESPGFGFSDLLASCDAVLTKPGYGTFVEAACAGVPVLTLERPDWPEAPYLLEWLPAHTRAAVLTREQLMAGALAAPMAELWAQAAPAPPRPTGNEEGARALQRLLETGR